MESHSEDAQSLASQPNEERFSPKGAFVFFVGLIVLYALLWFSLYADMLHRR
jgi:hypothetical protein